MKVPAANLFIARRIFYENYTISKFYGHAFKQFDIFQ